MVHWTTLIVVAAVSAAIAVVVVVLVACAVVGLSAGARSDADTAAPARVVGRVIASGCLLAALMIVLYGLFVIAA